MSEKNVNETFHEDCFSRPRFCVPVFGLRHNLPLRWNKTLQITYSGTAIQGTPSGPRKVSPEKRLGWGLLIINKQIKHFYFSRKRRLFL